MNTHIFSLKRPTNKRADKNGALFGPLAMIFLSLCACKPKPNAEATSPAQSASAIVGPVLKVAPVPSVPAPPSKQEVAKMAASLETKAPPTDAASSIAGGWVNAGGACDSGASVFFNKDGSYVTEGERGTWALNGKTLTVTTLNSFDEETATTKTVEDSAAKSILTLLSVSDDAARVVLENGSNVSWTRCSS